jgi:hypothetical protein
VLALQVHYKLTFTALSHAILACSRGTAWNVYSHFAILLIWCFVYLYLNSLPSKHGPGRSLSVPYSPHDR